MEEKNKSHQDQRWERIRKKSSIQEWSARQKLKEVAASISTMNERVLVKISSLFLFSRKNQDRVKEQIKDNAAKMY